MSESPDNPEVAHEESDVNVRAIFGFGAALVALAVVVHLVLWLLVNYYTKQAAAVPRDFPLSAEYQKQQPPEPRLQTRPQQDLRDLRAREDELLNGYGWIDKNAGVAHIPIEEAMKIIAQRGLPAREAAK